MARWRLTNKHYLNIPGTEYEYRETSQQSGRQVRKIWPVPTYLDPDNPRDHNFPGMIVVGQGKSRHPDDYEFSGPPTPDMEPMDDEAQELTDKERPNWVHPIESLEGNYGKSLEQMFERQLTQMMAVVGKIAKVNNVDVGGEAGEMVSRSEFEKLQAQLAEVTEKLKMFTLSPEPQKAAATPAPVARRV